LNELYRPFQVGTVLTAANEDLRAERAWGGEVGVDLFPSSSFAARATLFWTELYEPIANVTLPAPIEGAERRRMNLDEARVRGVELSGDWRLMRWAALTASYTFVDAVVVRADAAPQLVGKQLAQDPAHRTMLGVALFDEDTGAATLQLRGIGAQYEDDLNERALPGFFVVDASASRRLFGGVSAVVAVENLFDRTYLVGRAGVDTIGEPLLVRVGLRWRG
jgi:iron complex outermembrane recepter protein